MQQPLHPVNRFRKGAELIGEVAELGGDELAGGFGGGEGSDGGARERVRFGGVLVGLEGAFEGFGCGFRVAFVIVGLEDERSGLWVR